MISTVLIGDIVQTMPWMSFGRADWAENHIVPQNLDSLSENLRKGKISISSLGNEVNVQHNK